MRLHEQRIFNYELQPEGKQIIQMPKGAVVLGVIEKYGFPFLLATVDELEPAESRVFRVVTTGEIFNREISVFIGSLRLGGELKPDGKREVWYTMHVFEVETAFIAKHPDPIDPRFKPDLMELRRELRDADNVVPLAS